MRNVVLARVDDRLIHGEVVSVWTPNLSANCILVADDAVAQDKFNVRVLKSLAPDGVKVFVATVEGAIKGLLKAGSRRARTRSHQEPHRLCPHGGCRRAHQGSQPGRYGHPRRA